MAEDEIVSSFNEHEHEPTLGDSGAWRAVAHGVSKSQTGLKD